MKLQRWFYVFGENILRVISGKYKDLTIETLRDRSIRPTTDRVKESIFNLIQQDCKGSIVLDLFSGTGALGIESLSRGAKKAYFVDNSRKSLSILKRNLSKIDDNYVILERSYEKSLPLIKEKVSLIFIDPPYDMKNYDNILNHLINSNIIDANTTIVIEREKTEKKYKIPFGLYLYKSRSYGGSTIDIIKVGHSVVIPGTFDPFTKGHEFLVEQALKEFSKVNVVILDNPNKTPMLSLKKRLLIIKDFVRKFSNVDVDYYPGLTIDYCNDNNIRFIVRGVRNNADFNYEEEMAKWNEKNGGIKTLFFYAKDIDISSTSIRKSMEYDKTKK